MPVLSVRAVDDLLHFPEGHGGDLRGQFHQLITIALRQHVGMKRHDLSQLDICGAEVLQDRAQFLRRDTPCNVVLAKNRGDLSQSLPVVYFGLIGLRRGCVLRLAGSTLILGIQR